jgi:Flp pilus assembly protein TadD
MLLDRWGVASGQRIRYALFLGIGILVTPGLRRGALAADEAPGWVPAYQAAVQTAKSGDLAGAERAFQALWKANPTDAQLANAIGAAMNSAGNPDEAVGWFQRALKLNPGFAPAYNNLGLSYASRGMFAKAVGPLSKACELEAGNFRSHYNLGLVLIELQRYQDAAAPLERAHQLSPEQPDPLARLAYADLRAGRIVAARAAVAKLLKLPGDPQSLLLTALRTTNMARRYDETLRLARDQAAKPDSVEVRVEEAHALLAAGRYSEVVSLLGDTLPASQLADGYLLLGSAQALQGDLANAVATLQTTVRLDPANPEAYYRLGLVFFAGYRDRDAREVLEEGLKRTPDSARLLNALATVLETGGKRDEAVQALERSVKINASQEEAWAHLGDLYSQAAQAEKARGAYSRSVRLGASPESYANFADYLIRLERLDEAGKVAAEGLAKFPENADLHYEMGKVYQRRGNLPLAEKALRRSIALNGDNGSAHYALATVLQAVGKSGEAAAEFRITREAKSQDRQRKVLRSRLIPADETLAQPTGAGSTP